MTLHYIYIYLTQETHASPNIYLSFGNYGYIPIPILTVHLH